MRSDEQRSAVRGQESVGSGGHVAQVEPLDGGHSSLASSSPTTQRPAVAPPGEWAALAGLLLVGALVGSVLWAWHNPAAEGYYAAKQADRLLWQGRYLHAVDLLERTLTTYDSPQIRLSLSYAYLARRDAAFAELQARRAVEYAPPAFRSAAWSQVGRALAFAGRDDEALDAWGKSLAASPGNGGRLADAQARSAAWHSAMTQWKRGDWTGSRARLEELLDGRDRYARSAALKLAQLVAATDRELSLRLLDDLEGGSSEAEDGAAIPDLRVPGLREGLSEEQIARMSAELRNAHEQEAEARSEGAGEVAIADTWGTHYLQQGETRLAIQYLERALSLRPDSPATHARMGAALVQAGDEAGALDHLERSVRLDGQQPLARYVLAQVYIGKGDWDRANAELIVLRGIDPVSVDLQLQLAEYYRLRGQYDEAEGAYVEAATLQRAGLRLGQDGNEGGVDAMLALARFYTDVRGYGCEKGLPAAQQSLAFHPDEPASLDAVGWATLLCEKPGEALAFLEKAVEQAPQAPRYRYHLAKAYMQLGRIADARDQYTWMRDLDPGGSWEQLAVSEMVSLPEDR